MAFESSKMQKVNFKLKLKAGEPGGSNTLCLKKNTPTFLAVT